MAANDEFSRGWSISNAGINNITTSTIIPAVLGISHVLDNLSARLLNGNAAPQGYFVTITFGNIAIMSWVLQAVASGGVDEFSLTGLGLMAPTNTSINVTFSGSAVSVDEFLLVQGHDI